MRGSRVWTALCLAACTGDAGSDDTDGTANGTGCAAPLATVIGTGATAYEALADGASVTMVHGPQGGWHVETAAVVSASAQEVSVMPRITVPSLGDLQIAGEQQPQYLALADYDASVCEGRFWGVRAFIDEPDPAPDGVSRQEFICSLEGVELEFSVTVTDLAAGVTAESTVTVIAQLDPSDASLPAPQGCL
jgi:hypothetical protein